MPHATFRFYEELNDFLPKHKRKTDFHTDFEGKRTIKDMIEALGMPYTEVDLILVNGESVDFTYILHDGDRISVYPIFESLNIENVTRLRNIPLRRTRFIADSNLGDIVKYMRALGFDVFSHPSLSTQKIIEISKKENRIILTRSRKLLKFKEVTHGIFIRPGRTEEQLRKIVDLLDIRKSTRPFSRCLRCNNLLKTVEKEAITARIPSKVKAFYDDCSYCTSCDKICWEGIHVREMKKVIERILRNPESQESS